MEIAVIGREDFCLGFELAGVGRVFNTEDPAAAISAVQNDAETGIVIFDENLLEKLDVEERESLAESLKPVYINLSTRPSEESLKKMIRKSIGVDLN